MDVKVAAPYMATGQHHKVRKVTNAGTWLCSYIPETKNVVVSERYTLKTSNSWQGVLKMVSEFAPAGIIGVGLPTSTIHQLVLGDWPDDFVDVLRLSGPKRMRVERWEPKSVYRSLLKCVSYLWGSGIRRIIAYSI